MKKSSIPVNRMAETGISVERLTIDPAMMMAGAEIHRHDRHGFFVVEQGTVTVEIDFERYELQAPALMYVHPDQVHRTTATATVVISCWSLTDEHLHHDLHPAKPVALDEQTFTLICDTVNVALQFPVLYDMVNALVALVIPLLVPVTLPRIANVFRQNLEAFFKNEKSPSAYAQKQNISTAYLNECLKAATGLSTTDLIQQRVILEAKRLLVYSDRSVKEIAAELGYDDYPYFSRIFTKVVGQSALSFRESSNNNR